ncbi:EamA family transporter [Alphaproteobacteria bacterium GH1-50]|uniref:EamA family transporter n=1 Tax=Kangsaoukella pontilimi TaxID=2691042 RepID=A0A7C9J0S0_9RHOB|nr:DMT family transporter [Kangsaoukella pontilimi]MXQ06321.1 EamA family transporter [Kangsaoukella pontilimi]
MELWIIFSVVAAAAQSVRFAIQKTLAADTLGPAAATWARFLWSAPLVAIGLWAYLTATGQTLPDLSLEFWVFGASGGLFQILATICTVALFRRRAFSVGITFKKTEVMLTALAGLVILGDVISTTGAAAIAVGFVAVLLLSSPPEGGSPFNAGAALGLLSGVFFALAAVTYRGATLSIEDADLIVTAGTTLTMITFLQTVMLGVWLAFRQPGQITETLKSWRRSGLVGVFSMIGSFSWFAAFSLQNAAYVFAVGQIELLFSLLIGRLIWGERPERRESVGMALLTLSIVTVAAVG